MSRPGAFDHSIGTDFTLNQSYLSPPGVLRLDDIVSEDYQTLKLSERKGQGGPAFAVLKFTCHNTSNPAQQGFIRMYLQIPYGGTLRSSQEIRASQAKSSHVHGEYEALTTLHKQKCTVVPDLLGYGQDRQRPEAYVPNGYITYVAWQRVPGSPLDLEMFWREGNRQYRDEVRTAFAAAYKELIKHSWQPAIYSPRKLIYDHPSKTMHFSGFRMASRITDEALSVLTYALWGLVKHPARNNWHLTPSDWTW